MSLWAKIETAPSAASLFSWKLRFGEDASRVLPWFLKEGKGMEPAKTVPCPRHCGCFHRVNEEGKAVCGCGDCEEIRLTPEDVEVWKPDWTRLRDRVCEAFDLKRKPASFAVPRVWQVGSYGGGALAVVLVVRPDRTASNEAMAQLVARLKGRFVVLAPTLRHDDIESRDLLGRVNSGLVDLESNVGVLPSGEWVPLHTANDLFSPYLPKNDAMTGDGVMAELSGPRDFFRKAGDYWDVVFDGGAVFHVEHTLGARYVDYLLHHPNAPISAFDLERAVRPEKAAARAENSIQPKADPETIRGYLREVDRLRPQRERAKEEGNDGEANRLDGEIADLEAAIENNGQVGDTGERARGNVTKAIAALRQRLNKGNQSERDFARHIEQFVNTGYECMYSQEGRNWG